MTLTHTISRSAWSALLAATLASMLVLASFFMLEPKVGLAISDSFTVTQSITSEISFVATPNDVTLSPSIAGLTGGTSSGSTTVRVRTNNDTGYNMTIAFSTTTAMQRNGGGGVINNYEPASAGTPDYTFAPETFAQFSYTVLASTTSDVDPTFLDNESNACATGASNGVNTCWYGPSTAAETIINRSTATSPSGATTTIGFRVNVPSNPSPSVQEGTYVATATLTALTN